MRHKTWLAAMVLGLLTLTAGCSGADAVLDPGSPSGGGAPPETVDGSGTDLGGGDGAGSLGAR